MTEEIVYQPPSKQEYQHRILIYEANGLIGHRLVEYFRNDHIIELNPNIITGTIKADEKYANSLGIDVEIDIKNDALLNSSIAASDVIVFPLTNKNTQQFEYLLKLLKCLKLDKKKKVICISPIFTWKNKNLNPTFKKQDFALRNSQYSAIKQLENLCLALQSLNAQVTGCVINSGLVYGMGEDALFTHFKQALEQKENLKIYGRGTNHIPTIHVDDLAQFVFDISFSNAKGFFFAADHGVLTQKQIITQISQTLGNGKVDEVPIQNAFLQQDYDIFNSDIMVDPKSLPDISVWKYKEGLLKNMGSVVGEFNKSRGLRPNKILIHGPPASGKSKLADTLAKNYGLPILHIKGLIEDIKAEDSPFANEIKGIFEEIKAIRIEQERKINEDAKKKKKGKGVEDFDPSKVTVRFADNQINRILKRRINMADCLNKGYIIDGVLKSYAQFEAVFLDDGKVNQNTLPNSVFCIEATDDELKDRVKKLPADVTEGTHWTEEQTVRRIGVFNKQNEGKKWSAFFQDKVDIKVVPFSYTDANQLISFIERNGPLGFKIKPKAQVQQATEPQQDKDEGKKNVQQHKDEEEQESDREEFNLEKLTQNETKILNEKSRPIRQYLIDNVIPQITQGLLEICKETPPDPIKFLIHFLEAKRSKKKKTVRKI